MKSRLATWAFGLSMLALSSMGCATADENTDEEIAAGEEEAEYGSDDVGTSEEALSSNLLMVVGKSMRGVKMDASWRRVRSTLGTPDAVKYRKSEIMGTYKVYRYGLTEFSFAPGGGVFSIDTKSPKVKTSTGVGLGSTMAKLKADVRGLQCENYNDYIYCSVGRSLPGEIVTSFSFGRSKTVQAMSIGTVID